MQRCLDLALLGAGYVAPNPMVGAVLVHDNRVIGEGYHQQYGGPHAEVNCINSVAADDEHLISKSSLYVSLEPCVHFGKTPPCTDLIIKKNIPGVVIACRDSYDEVNGKGIEKLSAKAVNVITGILEKEAQELNKRFFTFHRYKRPYIILKWAQCNDGKISAGTKKRTLISNELSNRLVHKWRSEEAAIMVGSNTASQDDPALTARLWPGKNPLRLVIDMQLKLPKTLQLFDGKERTIIFNAVKQAEEGMISYQLVNPAQQMIPQLFSALYERGVQSVLVEGGRKLLQSFIDASAWDEAKVICNEQLAIGNEQLAIDAPILSGNELISTQYLNNDKINIYKNRHLL